jgi:three-Cys-motif partner protein
MVAKAERECKVWPPPEYWYFDINAGAGYCPGDGEPGSPVIFAEEARNAGVPARAMLYECERENCDLLRCSMADFKGVHVYPGDHRETLLSSIPDVDRPRLGLLYCDPSGTCPPFDLLADFAANKLTERVDLLVYLGATNIKRVHAVHADKGHKRLDQLLASIPKEAWVIREAAGHEHWTFAFGSRWDGIKRMSLGSKGFHPIDGPEGRAILHRLTFAEGKDGDTVFDVPTVSEDPGVPPGEAPCDVAECGEVRGLPGTPTNGTAPPTLPGMGDF